LFLLSSGEEVEEEEREEEGLRGVEEEVEEVVLRGLEEEEVEEVVLRGLEEEVVEEEVVLMALRLLSSRRWGSADRLLPMLLVPDEGEEPDGEGEEPDGEGEEEEEAEEDEEQEGREERQVGTAVTGAWPTSLTLLMRLLRISRLRAGPLLPPVPPTFPPPPPPTPVSAVIGRRGSLRAGGVAIWPRMAGVSRGLRMMGVLGESPAVLLRAEPQLGGLTGACRVRTTCWLLTYLALSASSRSTALRRREPGSASGRRK
jgi:hypothetical protein